MNTVPPRRQSLQTLVDEVEGASEQLAAYLPDGVPIRRFLALARRAILEQPELAECSANSVLRALSSCASSGLPLDGKFSSLIVRRPRQGRPTAHWDPSYRGMIAMALASGQVVDVQSFVVREGDEFHVELGSEPRIEHLPSLLPNHGPVIAAYAWARLRSGSKVIEILGRGDIDKIKASSPAGERGPWGSWSDEMARKSAIRRLLKRLPAGTARMCVPQAPESPECVPQALDRVDIGRSAQDDRPGARSGDATTPTLTSGTTPEDDNALECAALERLRDAGTLDELQAAWGQTQIEYQQRGIAIPLDVEACRNECREILQDLAGAERAL